MKYLKIFILLCCSICLYCKGFSQGNSIKIGETCPDIALAHIVNFKSNHANIADFRDKPLILDFWATWCAPCISMIAITDSLQRQFAGKIQILGVTDQDAATAGKFLDNLKRYKKISMPSVTGDRQLNEIFKHTEIPHYVWLDKNSKVVAITGAEQINAATIQQFVSDNEVALPVKSDNFKTINEEAPMFFTGYEILSGDSNHIEKIAPSNLLFHSVITGYIDGFGCESRTDSQTITCKNYPIGDLYRMAAGHNRLAYLEMNSTIWEITNSQLKMFTDSASLLHAQNGAEVKNWMSQYTFCYELKFPKTAADKKFDLMLRELNSFFELNYNITGGLEKRQIKCLALIETDPGKIPLSVSPKSQYLFDQYHLQVKNAAIGKLLDILSINLDRLPPLIDKTNDLRKVDLDINCNMSDINSLNDALSANGLKFVEEVTEKDMIVIKDMPLNK